MVRSDIFNLKTLQLLSEYWLDKVVAIDIETNVVNTFLHDEYILAVSLAVRTSGEMTSTEGITLATFVLDEVTDEAEGKLLSEVNDWLGEYKPLGVIGYQSRAYDIPWLLVRNAKHQRRTKVPLWNLIDTLQDTVHVDLYFLLKTLFKVKNLREVLEVPSLQYLPLEKSKELVSTDFIGKGEDIIRMWESDRKAFIRYARGDAINPLVIAEHLIKNKGA